MERDMAYGTPTFHGDKYEGWISAADAAKKIRADIKAAVATGALPGTAKDYRVTSDSYSMGQSVQVTLLNHTHFWGTGTDRFGMEQRKLTAEGEAVRATLAWMANRYNRDDSDLMSDYHNVTYYNSVTIEDERSRDWRIKEAARKAEARKNAAAKKALVEHLVAEHGQRKGKLRNYTYDRLVDAHDKHFASCGFENKEVA